MEKTVAIGRNGVQEYEEPVRRGPKEFNFWRGLYNKDKNYILGRTPRNWDEKTPKWTLSESRIGDNPGLGFRPMPKNISQGSLIWISTRNISSAKPYVEAIDQFLMPYEKAMLNPHENSVNCGFGNPPPGGKVCRVSLGQFGGCTSSKTYGLNSSQPCIFLKLNRIFNWQPAPYKADEGSSTVTYPERMPDDLKEYIAKLPENEKNQIFVSCEGQHEVDKESVGKITVKPRGFPNYYYPYTNEPGYLSPLVSVQFESPVKNKVINVECIAWATNIIYHGGERDRQGSIHFEFMIDN